MRQQQIQRMTVEAMDQGALLSQEDLSQILGVDVRTVRRDIQTLRKKHGILVPTRGQQKDIGPGVTHRVKAVTLYLDGKQPLEIAREIKHSLTAVERYINTFCRVVYCQEQFHDELKTALVVGVSVPAVKTYLDLHRQVRHKEAYQDRIAEIEKMGLRYYQYVDFKKKPGLTKRRSK
jgi:biotin operon repressor